MHWRAPWRGMPLWPRPHSSATSVVIWPSIALNWQMKGSSLACHPPSIIGWKDTIIVYQAKCRNKAPIFMRLKNGGREVERGHIMAVTASGAIILRKSGQRSAAAYCCILWRAYPPFCPRLQVPLGYNPTDVRARA